MGRKCEIRVATSRDHVQDLELTRWRDAVGSGAGLQEVVLPGPRRTLLEASAGRAPEGMGGLRGELH